MRSVGYSDLFVLSKKDMWDVLKEYPAARVRLEAIAVKRLEKYRRAPLEKGETLIPSAETPFKNPSPQLTSESAKRQPYAEVIAECTVK